MQLRTLFYLALVSALSSCATQNLLYTEAEGPLIDLMHTGSVYHHRIKTDDKVSLSIWNHDDMSVGSVFSIYNSNEAYGKWVLVDADGNVKLPKIGNVTIGGLTCPEAADTLEKYYATDLVDPVIVVKVLNREVTILGEVRTPGTYVLEKERNSIAEIFGKAQGFDKYADIDQVQLIRNGISYKLDLTSMSDDMLHTIIVESGDLIQVPSRKSKRFEQRVPVLIPFSSAITALAVVFSLVAR